MVTTMTVITEALMAYREARHAAEEAERRAKDAEQELLSLLAVHEQKTVSGREGDKTFRATYVQNERVDIDEEGLKKALGYRLWEKVSTRKVDRKKLEAAIEAREVDSNQVGMFARINKSRPYIRYTEGVAKDDDPAT